MIDLHNGDCLAVMQELPEQSIDAVICDPPYGTTACRWDAVIPLDKMWEAIYRVTKIDAPLVFTCQQPFTSQLILSNVDRYSHNWVWDKGYSTNFAHCNKMPMKGFEDVVVFWRKRGTYNPQGVRPVKERRDPRVVWARHLELVMQAWLKKNIPLSMKIILTVLLEQKENSVIILLLKQLP